MDARLASRQTHQLLLPFRAYWSNHTTTNRQLCDECIGQDQWCRCSQDAIERRLCRPSLHAISMTELDVAYVQFSDALFGTPQ